MKSSMTQNNGNTIYGWVSENNDITWHVDLSYAQKVKDHYEKTGE